jgi:hypothetical protein
MTHSKWCVNIRVPQGEKTNDFAIRNHDIQKPLQHESV